MSAPQLRLRSSPVEEKLGESGIWAFESRHGESFFMGFTMHRFPKLLLIREGVGQVESDLGTFTCKTGDCVLVTPGLNHRIVDDANTPITLYGLGVAMKLLACVPEVVAQLPAGVFSAEQLKPVLAEQRIRRILYLDGQSDAASRLACVEPRWSYSPKSRWRSIHLASPGTDVRKRLMRSTHCCRGISFGLPIISLSR